ncbi:Tetratricopeptide repeat protein 39C [Trichoplax sp. H2]|nr:Tetratricopeptide repeat protein 39C [Trichoplax sp. H2]|eukprot:RDD36004.1 Tetratricopeptide repeat protein 39C [Trichoplax sp. H2]
MKQASEQMKLVPQLARKRGNAPELFVIRKANQYKDVILQPHNYVLLILEVIYLWGAIRICGDHQLRQFLIETERSQESYISSLQVFMLGILHLQLRDIQLAEQYLKEAVRISKKSRQDNYIAPYATYELGLLLTEHAQGVSQGKSLLNQAKDNYSGYDLENRLHFRIHSALSRLK